MINLEIQIQSIAASIFFGLFVSITFNYMYAFMFNSKNTTKIATAIMYIFINATLYFIILLIINNGVVHNYFLLSLLIGFFLGNYTTRKIRKNNNIFK